MLPVMGFEPTNLRLGDRHSTTRVQGPVCKYIENFPPNNLFGVINGSYKAQTLI